MMSGNQLICHGHEMVLTLSQDGLRAHIKGDTRHRAHNTNHDCPQARSRGQMASAGCCARLYLSMRCGVCMRSLGSASRLHCVRYSAESHI